MENGENYFLLLIRQYKFLFLLLVMLFIAALVLLIIAFFNTTTPNTNTPSLSQTPNMTPPIASNNLTISSFSPPNNTTNGSLFEKITIVFSKPLTSNDKSSLLFSATPDIKGDQIWSNNNTTFSITPNIPLLPQKKYVLKIRYDNQSFLWAFTTMAADQLNTEDQIRAQSVADQNYGEAIRKQEETYPWLNNLPLQTSDYFVFFDTNKKQMIADLYPKVSSTISLEQQETSMKNQILNQLQTLGIDTTKYPPVWTFKPR